MLQGTLLTQQNIDKQEIKIDNIKAIFTELGNKFYEVLLDINSNKFLIKLQNKTGIIDNFEIITAKGFMELSHKSINTLKKLTEHLRIRLS